MPDSLRLRVVEVTDGDTIKAQARNGDTVTVRVWGIDAPESSQPYGPAATDVARRLVGGEVADIEIVDEDRYGRFIGRVRTGGTDLAASLALSGYAWHSRRYPTSQQIKNAEQTARRKARGLWSQDNPVPPWEYRGRAPAPTERTELTAGTVVFIVIVVAILVLISLAGG
jgi:endonuclease YncB( thermonuclease family)